MTDLERPAFYALRGGGWRDWWSLLHPPYTLWHLAYVCVGAATAPRIHIDLLVWSLLAFFFAMGLGAHALDELNGRPLRTGISSGALVAVAVAGIGGAIAIGVALIPRIGPTGIPFIAFGGFIVVAYNLEWFGGALHNDFWFAFAWGFFPAITAAWAQFRHPRVAPFVVAAACLAISAAQRTLSTPVRDLRRRTSSVEGAIVRTDGSVERLTKQSLSSAPEQALRTLSYAMPLLGAGAVLARYAR